MKNSNHIQNRLMSMFVVLCMMASMFAGLTFTAAADETVATVADENVSSFEAATEVIYCGATLDAETPYLHITTGENPTVIASASATPGAGYELLAEFSEGTLTYQYGFEFDKTNSATALYEEIGYNTFVRPTLHEDGIWYGIKANGSLTIDMDAWHNAVMHLWNDLTGNMNVIDVAGDLTFKGTSGHFKIHAVPGKDDVTDGVWHTNGIRTDGDVNFDGGEVYIYARPYVNSDEDDTSTFVNAGGNINLNGGKLKMRTWTGMPGEVTLLSSEPVITGEYAQEDNLDEDLTHSPMQALGFLVSTSAENTRNKTYSPLYTIAFSDTEADTPVADAQVPWGNEVDLTAEEYIPAKSGYSFDGWFYDSALTESATVVKPYRDLTVYAKWSKLPAAATEVIYSGYTLNSATPYLISWVEVGTGLCLRASSNKTLATGESVLAEFNPSNGTLTYRSGMLFATEENAIEDDFGWNTFSSVAKVGDAYYGIRANGDLIIDLGGHKNFIACSWNTIFTDDLYGIWADGDVTIKGGGTLKIPATLAMNKDAEKGDGNAAHHYSYGIYAKGDVNLDAGTLMIYSKNTERWEAGSRAHSIGIYAAENIYMRKTGVKFRYQAANGEAEIKQFNKTPIGIEEYVVNAITNATLDPDVTGLSSIGYCYDSAATRATDEENPYCFDYLAPIPATGITLAKDAYMVEVGESREIVATVTPDNAVDKSIVWKSSNETIVRVVDGVVTGLNPGTVTVTATTVDGGFVASCSVTVSAAAGENPATELTYCGVTLNASKPYLIASYTAKDGFAVRAQATDLGLMDTEYVFAYFDATKGSFTYKSGMQLVNDENGYEPDFGWYSYLDTVLIGDAYYGIKANGDLLVDLGGHDNFINMNWNTLFVNDLYGIYADGSVTITGDGLLKLPATLAMNKDATKGDGNATPHASYGIYAAGDITLISGTVVVYSKNTNKWNSGSNATSMAFYAERDIYLKGTTIKLRYEDTVGSGVISHFSDTPIGIAAYTKEPITNITVATGEFSSLGFCYIDDSITNGNCFNYYTLKEIEGVTLDKTKVYINKGEVVTLHARVLPIEAAYRDVNWSSSDSSIAKVSGGVVTGVGHGTAVISATTVDGSFTATCTVIVTDATLVGRVTGVTLDRSARYMEIGEEKTLLATVTPSDAIDKSLKWTSSDSSVARVEDGKVTAVGEGQATITVTTVDGGYTAECVITVAAYKEKNPATEVIYAGEVLNAEKPYLISWVVTGQGLQIEARSSEVLGDGETLLAEFDPETGTLTYKGGMGLATETNGYEADFGWNTYKDAVLIDGAYYGIKANGDLTISLNGKNNFINMNWNKLFTGNLYGIYADGDVTITGDGYLKLPATLAMNLDETKGDANAQPHYSYGIYAKGDVKLEDGTVMIYSRNYASTKSGSNANSVGIYAGRYIYLNGTKLKFRYEENVGEGKITYFSSTPEGNYTKQSVRNINMLYSEFASLGFCSKDLGAANGNSFDYTSETVVTGVELDRENCHLEKGANNKLVATVLPANAVNKNVVWTSSNEKVAKVAADGTVTAISEGTATITVKTLEGAYTASCTVTVTGAKVAKHATELIYGGVTLNASTPYLISWMVDGQGLKFKAQANTTVAAGEKVLGYFSASTGVFTYWSGYSTAIEEGGYEADFGWNTYANVAKIGDDYYGIKANGDLCIDLGPHGNFLYANWKLIYKENLYGIYADGDITIKGTGYLKVPATLAMNTGSEGDGNAEPHYSYGIYATGDVNLNGGTVMVYSRPISASVIGSNANSVGVYAGQNINLKGSNVKFRYGANIGGGNIKHFSDTPYGLEQYLKTGIKNIDLEGSLGSLGFAYIDNSIVNHNCYNYVIPVSVTGITLSQEAVAVLVGGQTTLTANITPADASNKKIEWTSSNNAIATAYNGVIKGYAPGTVTVTATTVDGKFKATCQVVVLEASNTIQLLVDGNVKALTQPIEVSGDGVVYVPLVETFKLLGVTMESYVSDVYVGHGKNGEIIVRVGESVAEVDWVPIELPGPVIKRNGTTMVPAYLIEDAIRTSQPVYNASNKTLSVVSPDPNLSYKGFGKLKTGEVMKTLTTGVQFVKPADFLVGSGKTNCPTANTYVSNVTENIGGTNYTAVQIQTTALPYGEIPEAGAMKYYLSVNKVSGGKDFNEGDVGVIHFKARSIDSTLDSKAGRMNILYERSGDWQKLITKDYELQYNVWNDYYVPFFAYKLGASNSASWPASGSSIVIQVGGAPQTIQIADFSVTYYGKTVDIKTLDPDVASYHGIEEDAVWRKEANRRIEKYRKEDVAIDVVDQNGNPIQGAEIIVKQTENQFMFGVEVCKNEILDLDLSTEIGRLMDGAMDSFNTAVCGLEMKAEKVLQDDGVNGIKMTNEFLERGMRMRGHVFWWELAAVFNSFADNYDYKSMTYDEIYRKAIDYVETVAYAFKGKSPQWDFLNEYCMDNYSRTHFDTTRLVTDISNAIHAIDPDVKLYLNETNTQGKDKNGFDRVGTLCDIVERMLNEGASVNGIGLQTHERFYYYPQGLYEQLDECAQVVEEVAVTEYDFQNTYNDNKTQYIIDNLIATYSHPQATAFMVWSYNSNGNVERIPFFYDENWNETPVKKAWDKQVQEVYRTNLSLASDKNGSAKFRGFHGDYEITVKYGGMETTIDFGVVNDADNEIRITIGDDIRADVSSGKTIIIPSEVEYESLSEARVAFEEEYGKRAYNTVALEKRFVGVANQSQVQNATTLSSNASYTNGTAWASSTGMAAIASDDTSGKGMVLKNGTSGSYTIGHLYPTTNIYNEGNLEMSYFIETGSSRAGGFSLALNFLTSSSTIEFGKIKTSSTGYYVETLGGSKLQLADNTIYDVQVTLCQTQTPGTYTVKYTVRQNNKIVNEIVEKQSKVNNFLGIKGISLTAQTNGADSGNVLTMRLARVKFYSYDPLLSFSKVGIEAEQVSDSFKHIDLTQIVPETDAAYISGEKWGTNTANADDYFTYFTETDHIFGVRTAPAGEKTISKKMAPLSEGETLEVKFDYYIPAPQFSYNSSGLVDVRLESADGSVKKSLLKTEASGTFALKVLETAQTINVPGGGRSQYNMNNLHVVCTLKPNTSGGYDATLTITNYTATTTTVTLANFLTKDQFLKLDKFVFASQTNGKGNNYGKGMSGIKNVVVTSTGAVKTTEGGTLTFNDGDVAGIKFSNPTARNFDAQLMLVRYVDDKFSSMTQATILDRDDKSGYLSIRLTKEKPEENNFLLMLLDGEGKMKPLKAADKIVIK